MNLTHRQQKTVGAPCGNILVCAAAGSGKTTTMTERIVSRIASGELDIRNVLVMTFTDAAAKSMRAKIEKNLRAAMQSAPPEQQARLRRQLAFLGQSSISTIHAFCLDVIRNFYYEASDSSGKPLLEPGFGIEEAGEANILLARSLDGLFEDYYRRCDEQPEALESKDFLFFVDAYGAPKDDGQVRELALSFYRFLRSMPRYEEWTDLELKRLDETILDFDRSLCCKTLREGLRLRAEKIREGLRELDDFLLYGPCLYKNEKSNFQKNADALDALRRFRDFLQEAVRLCGKDDAEWDELYAFFGGLPELPALSHHPAETPEKKQWIEMFGQYFAEFLYYVSGKYGTEKYAAQFLFDKCFAFAQSRAEITRDLSAMRPAVAMFFKILGDLDREYKEAKRKINMLDFDDFEHLALHILGVETVRQYYHERFREIYVDEYQDTSSIQEAILERIADGNCFMVGDVKQSIYRFRHARPRIFIEKRNSFQNGAGEGKVFELNENFRSVPGILHAVNDVFFQIMSAAAGEIDYDGAQALVPGCGDKTSGEASACRPVELLLVDLSKDSPDSQNPAPKDGEGAEAFGDEAEGFGETLGETEFPETKALSGQEESRYRREAEAVAVRIREMLGGGLAAAPAPENTFAPGDIAVLARTRNICGIFADALRELGIPVEQELPGTFLDQYELKVLESLLRLLDNPMQDIPLASVLRAPLFENGFGAEELLRIRVAFREKTCFYECCEGYAHNGPDPVLREKMQSFYRWLAGLREMLTFRSVGELIEEIYSETQLLAVTSKMPDGLRRIAALQDFQDWANQYDRSRQPGLYAFLRYVEAIREKSPDQSPFGVEESRTDAVKVMTMHKSKGLEYKAVFLTGTTRGMTSRDVKAPILVSEDFGIGFHYADVGRRLSYPTPLVLAMRESMLRAGLAEEMRLLYVGMTRAMEKLVITGTFTGEDGRNGKSLVQRMEKAQECPYGVPLPAHMVLSAKNPLEWILMALARNPSLDLRPLGVSSYHGKSGYFEEDAWSLTTIGEDDVRRKMQLWRNAANGAENSSIRPAAAGLSDSPSKTSPEPGRAALQAPGCAAQEEALRLFRQNFFYEYPYEAAARSPLKITVSEIKRREQEIIPEMPQPAARESSLPSPLTAPLHGVNTNLRELRRPAGASLSASEIGIAVHSFFRYMDLDLLDKNPTAEAVSAHMDRMLAAGMIRPAEREALQHYAEAFEKYLRSALARRILKAQRQPVPSVYREMPFTLRLDCRDFPGGKGFGKDDYTFVQGMIDCWFIEEGEAVLVDYKTDRIPGTFEQVRKVLEDRYRTQLSVYAMAIEKTARRRVKKAVLWHAEAAQEFEIEPGRIGSF